MDKSQFLPSVTFRLKKPKGTNPTLVYLFFRGNNLDVKYSTSQRIAPKFWNSQKQRAKETSAFPASSELNTTLGNLENCIENAYRKYINDKIVPTPDLLKNELDIYLQKEKPVDKSLLSFAEYISNNTDRKPGTTKQLKQTIRLLKEFGVATKYNLHLDGIDLKFYDSFIEFLTTSGYKKNSIGSHIKNVKVFMNEALDRNLTTNIQFKNKRFKKLEEESENIYLTANEIDKISNLDLTTNPSLDRVRDLFIIACNTGLRFSDLVKLKSENIINDGLQIKIATQKTGETIVVPIKSIVRRIFHKYYGILPTLISNQKMNDYLKTIGKDAKIDSDIVKTFTKRGRRQSETFKKYALITTHTGRRSFATNAFLANVPVISIMKITGHRTEKSFLKYIKISPEENANKLLSHPFFT